MIRFRPLGGSRSRGGSIAHEGQVFRIGGRLRNRCQQLGVIVRIAAAIVEQAPPRAKGPRSSSAARSRRIMATS